MEKRFPNYLKLHVESSAETAPPQLRESVGLQSLIDAFGLATGWQLAHAPGLVDERAAIWSAPIEHGGGALLLKPSGLARSSEDQLQSLDNVRPLASAVARLLGELAGTRHALWQREAELAAGVPVVQHAREDAHLAERLEAVLRGGAEAIGCHAAALYLLDDATTQLKMRAGWGLPPGKLLEPARPLRGALADLEALIGHAVALEDAELLPHWRPPEDFPAALCVPVSSPTNPLGTLWFFSGQKRAFTDPQTQLAEIVAGRLAADLEREVLLRQGVETKQLQRQLRQAQRWQQLRLPTITPLLDDWQLAGWAINGDNICSSFHDWCVLPDGNVALAVGDVHRNTIDAALAVVTLQTATRAHAAHPHTALQLVQRVNETLWTASPGDEPASLFYGVISPETGQLDCCAAGHQQTYVISQQGASLLPCGGAPLGLELESRFCAEQTSLERGAVLLALTPGTRPEQAQAPAAPAGEPISALVHRHRNASAKELVEMIRDQWSTAAGYEMGSLLVVKRCP